MNSLVWYHRALLSRHESAVWPADARFVHRDIRLGARSALELVEVEGTPLVRTAPSAHGQLVSVLITRVDAVLESLDFDGIDVWTDAELTGCRPLLHHCRLLARTSAPRTVRARLRPTATIGDLGETIDLPADLRAGDLLAIPCQGPTALYDVQRHSRHSERLTD